MEYAGINLQTTTASALYAEAISSLQQIEHSHRRATIGKRLVPHLHGWDRPYQCRRVSVRVDGQSIDLATFRAASTETARALFAELQILTENSPAL